MYLYIGWYVCRYVVMYIFDLHAHPHALFRSHHAGNCVLSALNGGIRVGPRLHVQPYVSLINPVN